MKFFLIIVIVGLVMYILYIRKNIKIITIRINEMLDLAIKGNFTEKSFDESELSKIESKFYRYLLDSQATEKNLINQKKNIEILISDISHQSKTPISNIVLYSQLLKENQSIEYIDEIIFQANKLSFLIRNLIKTSRLETGVIKLNPSLNSVNNLIKNIISSSLKKAEEKNIYIDFVEDDDHFASFDFKWTEEAIYNIVDNGIKYGLEHGNIHIKIIEYTVFLRIDIINNGIEIKEEEINKIFQRFYRGENARDREGVGIGLYLSREIIEGQGGYIQVESFSEQTRFSVFLPKDKNLM
ncbi:HAMP domain-containing sensor histidine kinase [Tissierella sp.]|uniref:sensor histidine kinase n=1 Tax=Tissierella sp. TaxID=41274 RepID=UPI0028B24FA3|nr:HAMP domain-containing sensor histidine kinase [Tissierella sp.]